MIAALPYHISLLAVLAGTRHRSWLLDRYVFMKHTLLNPPRYFCVKPNRLATSSKPASPS